MINEMAINVVSVLTDVCTRRSLVPTQMTILMGEKPISSATFTRLCAETADSDGDKQICITVITFNPQGM